MPVIFKYNLLNKFLAVLMTALLLFLTSINFFIFPTETSGNKLSSIEASCDNNQSVPDENEPSPNGPDEKTPGNPVSFSEEYLHDQHEADDWVSDNLVHQVLLVCSKVHPAHTELITPPPDLFS